MVLEFLGHFFIQQEASLVNAIGPTIVHLTVFLKIQ